jgi:DNA gyrase subunit A
MGRDTSGVRGMDVSGKDNYVLAMDVARPGQDLLVVTEAGYGKRTDVDEYRLTSRGAKGVKTISFTEAKGLLAAALVVREHEDLVFISQNGMVQRTGVRGINRYGRAAQGVRVMNLREGDEVSAVALVVETDEAAVGGGDQPVSLDASGVADEPVVQGEVEGVISTDPLDEPDIVPDEAEPREDDIGPADTED